MDEVEQNIVICQWRAYQLLIGETLTNHDIVRRPSSIIVLSFDPQVCFHILITSWQLREAISHFSLENVVPITHEQNIICSKTRLDDTTHEQTIICRQLFAGHVVGCRPMEGKEKLHRMINPFIFLLCYEKAFDLQHL